MRHYSISRGEGTDLKFNWGARGMDSSFGAP